MLSTCCHLPISLQLILGNATPSYGHPYFKDLLHFEVGTPNYSMSHFDIHATYPSGLIILHTTQNILTPLNSELNPICYLLALLAHHFLHVSMIRVKSLTLSMIRVKSLTLRLLMSYIYGAPILDVSRSHTTTQHSR